MLKIKKILKSRPTRLPACGTGSGRRATWSLGTAARATRAQPAHAAYPRTGPARGSPNPARKTNTSRRRIAPDSFGLPSAAATQPQPDPPRLRRQEQGSGGRVSLPSPLPCTRFTRRLATGGPRPLDSYARPRRRSGRHRNPRVPTKQVADRPSCGASLPSSLLLLLDQDSERAVRASALGRLLEIVDLGAVD